jgi:hypothetical protein
MPYLQDFDEATGQICHSFQNMISCYFDECLLVIAVTAVVDVVADDCNDSTCNKMAPQMELPDPLSHDAPLVPAFSCSSTSLSLHESDSEKENE